MAWFDGHICHYEGVQGGAAVVVGTRTPVRTIVARHRTYSGRLDMVLQSFPHLTEDQVRAALAYYDQHAAEIDADTARHRKALAALAEPAAS